MGPFGQQGKDRSENDENFGCVTGRRHHPDAVTILLSLAIAVQKSISTDRSGDSDHRR
jgi:hypothetical protein